MKKQTLWPKNAKQIKGKVAIAELKRAHLIITLLSFASVPLVIIGAIAPVQLDKSISAILSVLLVVLGLISLSTIVLLNKK